MKKVAIVGTGLLGGSFALALRDFFSGISITAVNSTTQTTERAIELGIADKGSNLKEACREAELIVLAAPVTVILQILPEVLDYITASAVVVDFGSTKYAMCKRVAYHPKRGRYVALHPMAGTENSGPDAAFKELLIGKKLIICEQEKSDFDALDTVRYLFGARFSMDIYYIQPDKHDVYLAYASHLSHLTSFALANTALRKQYYEPDILKFAATGFRDTARLAKSPASMWAPIFEQNKEAILEALQEYIDELNFIKEKIQNNDQREIYHYIEKANRIAPIIDRLTPK
ncbi:MAG: prephenate dehydrogenase/arogenate dehydrogenase family protein [Cytophagales bacterium]|nr:prephenate dehydrogenase/arogenate dehydrogenase family protein [Cytophagales bacterium]MDW8383363.1 prephenate dehydrogenase/arogenate dehydrogenase family protein [Flammeovirgaceae bacterium]